MDTGEEEVFQDQSFDRILKVIRKIKNNRNRAGYQNILTFYNRSEPKLTMQQLKETLKALEEKGMIVNKSKDDIESFCTAEHSSEKTLSPSKEKHGGDSIEDLMHFLDESFQTILIGRIKDEIMSAVDVKIENLNLNELKVVNSPDNHTSDSDTIQQLRDEITQLKHELRIGDIREISKDELIDNLRNEICFLKGEIDNKNAIITILANDRKFLHDRIKGNAESITEKKDERNNVSSISGKNTNPFNAINEVNISECNNERPTKSNVNRDITQDDGFIPAYENKKKGRRITILGTSMVKHVEGYKMKKRLKKNEKVYVKSFPGATIQDLVDYSVPSRRYNPDLYILQGAGNDLCSGKNCRGNRK